MFPVVILKLIESCEAAAGLGISREEIRHRLLPEKVKRVVKNIVAEDFIAWLQTDPDYQFYYREMQAAGLQASPMEMTAMILEAIVLDALD